MVNCNPETVSTDYDTSDRLYFEPLTAEDVLEIIRTEQQSGKLKGVIVQFGGQTPLKLAHALSEAGIPILGTQPDAIDLAEDRNRFKVLIQDLKLLQPESGIAKQPAGRARDRRWARLPDRDPSLLRAGRTRHGDRPRWRRRDRWLRRAAVGDARPAVGADRVGAAPSAHRPVSDRCGRGRCRLPERWPRYLHRRHHGAHRGSGHSLGRQRLLAADALARHRHRSCGWRSRPATSPSRSRSSA